MRKKFTIALGSDHAGFKTKQKIKNYLSENNYSFHDFGSYSENPSDYPDFAHKVASSVEKTEYSLGIVVCGSGNGVNMVVNKYPGIRSALCWRKDIAEIVRRHNDANICAIPGRYIDEAEAIEIVRTFLTSEFEGGRHLRRINKIPYKNDL